jgi:hypothetical protein
MGLLPSVVAKKTPKPPFHQNSRQKGHQRRYTPTSLTRAPPLSLFSYGQFFFDSARPNLFLSEEYGKKKLKKRSLKKEKASRIPQKREKREMEPWSIEGKNDVESILSKYGAYVRISSRFLHRLRTYPDLFSLILSPRTRNTFIIPTPRLPGGEHARGEETHAPLVLAFYPES